MAITRTPARLDLARIEPREARPDEDSLAHLATRLAQESVALASVEIRRLGAEVHDRRRYVARAAVAGTVAVALALVGVTTLAGAAVLYLGRMWQSYAAGALATGVLLVLFALAASWMVAAALRGLTEPTREANRDAEPAQERSSHGT
jgi:uncharacterized membrane protein YqjE